MADALPLNLTPEVALELFCELDRNIPAALYRFVLYPDGRVNFPYISTGIRSLSGDTAEDVVANGHAFTNRIYPEDAPSFQQNLTRSLETMQSFYWEGRAYRVDGSLYWARITSNPRPGPDGTFIWDGVMLDVSESVRAQEAERAAMQQQAIIREQAELLSELSTPLIPISDGVLVMPLIGTLTDRRAQQVMETLLEGIVQYQAETVLLDITGVKTVDTSVANALIQVARAVNLIGSHIILTGIQPRIAQTLVQLGVSLGDIVTYSTLQAGIASILAAQQPKPARSFRTIASAS